MQNSSIEWTDHTFNPWWGCQRVSPGCEHCYAETLAHRYNFKVWGPAKTTGRREMSENYWKQPFRWDRLARETETRARVFCASMADVFEDHPGVVDWRMRLWDVIHLTPNLDWLLLTKRPENVMQMIPIRWLDQLPRNIWLGTSCEDQKRADERIPHLLNVPARVRFLSCEPLLGALDIRWALHYPACPQHPGEIAAGWGHMPCDCRPFQRENKTGLEWIICGGESGTGARPMAPAWARSLRDQCQDAGVAYFFKQWGAWVPECQGVDFDVWDGYTSAFAPPNQVYRVGKHAAGRLLDGRTWDEVPQ